MVWEPPLWVWHILLIHYDIKIVKVFIYFIFNIYHLYSCLLKYFINRSVASYLVPYFVLLDLCTVVGNYITSDYDTPPHLPWFWNIFTKSMGDLVRCNSDYMDSYYGMEDPKCSILTMDPAVSMVLTTVTTYTHDLTKNLLRFVYW